MKLKRIVTAVLLVAMVLSLMSAAVAAAETETVPMYRLYNPNSGEHFYTGSVKERDDLVAVGWNYEGIGWNAPVSSGAPVYRVFNPNSGDHHYTMSQEEIDMLVGLGWQYEGVCWNSPSTGSPQYRLYNPNADLGSHHYTSSVEERENLVSLGWVFEGIGWYGAVSEGHTHSYQETVTVPTCTEQGYTTYTCACGDSYKGNETAALGHKWGNWCRVEDSSTGEVLYEERFCQRDGCAGIEKREFEDIASTCEHDWRKRNGGGYYCPLCKTIVEELPEGDHCHEYEWVCDSSWEFDTGTCKNCGETKVIYASSSNTSQAVVDAINVYRRANELPDLQWKSGTPETRIRMRATEITIQLNHRRLDGSGHGSAECIGAGYGSAQAAVDGWYNSSSHNGIIMRADAKYAVAAYNGVYWVVWVV